MKKSNWLIAAILVVASIVFLVMWYVLGFNLVDDPLDLVVSIVWWVVIIAACVFIHLSEKKRQRAIRTSFLAPGLIYNSEVGVVKLDDSQGYTPQLQHLLDNLSYNFSDKQPSNKQHVRFTYIVRSDKFSNNGNTWTGEVVKVSNPNDPISFQNKRELAHLIDAA